ncbi:hypothetical protein N7462_011283 [Penicillium macrosclerotiorum]|uniref:uncharacterized protein n=1 Tax=Penicillium macrosclerotiorum TaxID=303699 RepID=UPI002549B6A3|nr:uncharacterized protein N7462_011283 [Penicillium macrosclerotiorum]KAJ5666874.1 hypothetical protein N7462_011283 [Penicillium macrosclerotiorum]
MSLGKSPAWHVPKGNGAAIAILRSAYVVSLAVSTASVNALSFQEPQQTRDSQSYESLSNHSIEKDDTLPLAIGYWSTSSNYGDIPASWLITHPPLRTAPSLLPTGHFPETAVLDKWAINQLLRAIKNLPKTFAHFQKTHFIHNRLYDEYLPETIQDAFAVSTAYLTKTVETEDIMFRILGSKSASCVNQDHQESTPLELLAAIQALMLFQIIQLFDGDIRQRSVAEQNMFTLRA